MSAHIEPAAEPTLDPGVRALLDRWADEPEMFDGTVAESRARFVTQMRVAGGAPARAPELGEAGGVPVRTHRPATRTSDALVVFLHGGGWVLGGGDVYDAVADRLADDLGAVVAAVDYRLAPEHPFPAPLDDVLAAVRALLADGPERYALVGDSAGANLAAVAALALRDEGRAPDALLLVYPPPDFEARYPSLAENAEGTGSPPATYGRARSSTSPATIPAATPGSRRCARRRWRAAAHDRRDGRLRPAARRRARVRRRVDRGGCRRPSPRAPGPRARLLRLHRRAGRGRGGVGAARRAGPGPGVIGTVHSDRLRQGATP